MASALSRSRFRLPTTPPGFLGRCCPVMTFPKLKPSAPSPLFKEWVEVSTLPRPPHLSAHLLPREAAIAVSLDRLPDGADISVKTLAKTLDYGQCALRTALNNLQRAGHLRRGRGHLTDSKSPRWITRTWFTRTARDDNWWATFTRGDVPEEPPQPAR